MYTQIECPSCHTIIKAQDVWPGERKAECSNCGHQFDISKDIDIRIRRKNKIYQPEGVTMYKTRERMEIGLSMGLLPKGCSFWPIFGGLSITLTLILLLLSWMRVGVFQMVFGYGGDYMLLLFFFVVVLLISFSIAFQMKKFGDVSKIDIKATREQLAVVQIEKGKNRNSDTMPKRSKSELQPQDIVQFYVVEQNVQGVYFYSLYARDTALKEIEVLPLVKKLQWALFVEQELEEFYDIKDREELREVNV